MTSCEFLAFKTKTQLAEQLASDICTRLNAAIREKDEAVLAVSGGSTPKLFFQTLSRARINWAKVIITLVDERFVPVNSDRSNEQLVKQHLLKNKAAAATFVGLMHDAPSAEAAAELANEALVGKELDCVVLGMGIDGHTASFFPGTPELPDLLRANATPRICATHPATVAESRLTFNFAALAASRFVALHIEGTDKRAVFDTAKQSQNPEQTPISVFLTGQPVTTYWTE